jgi:hypothetical protein
MEDSKNLTSDKISTPSILSLKELYELNIIYVMFILNGNRSAVSKALSMSVRSLRDNLRLIEEKRKLQFPLGGALYKMQFLKYNYKDVPEAKFIEQINPVKYIKELRLFVSQYGFPYMEISTDKQTH